MKTKSIALIFSTLLLLVVIIGATVAYLTTNTSDITNTFIPGNVKITVDEEFDGESKTNVRISNPSNTEDTNYSDVYVRVMLVCNWYRKTNNTEELVGKPSWDILDAANQLNINDTDWFECNDGFYYYKKVLKPGESTTNLINSIKLLQDTNDGTHQGLEIIAEGIQADGISESGVPAVEEAWRVVEIVEVNNEKILQRKQ